MKRRFYFDRYPQQDITGNIFVFSGDNAAKSAPLPGSVRCWFEVEVPTDEQLWPEAFTGFELKEVSVDWITKKRD